MAKITPAMVRVLKAAAERPGGYIRPISGMGGNAQRVLIEALDRRGLITWSRVRVGEPRISGAGRAAVYRG